MMPIYIGSPNHDSSLTEFFQTCETCQRDRELPNIHKRVLDATTMDKESEINNVAEKLQKLKVNNPTEHESRLQDTDGRFFEIFGSLLKQKSEIAITELDTYLQSSADAHQYGNLAAGLLYECEEEESKPITCFALEKEVDTHELNDCKENFVEVAVGMNIEDLYEEILFIICNNLKCKTDDVDFIDLLEFVQDVFNVSTTIHDELLKSAVRKESPKLRLNVEIVKAENLMPKDANGFSDPFVTLYLESNGSHRYNSSVKYTTLNPVWEEHFSLPITDDLKEEALIVEIWDFDAAETVKEKVNKLFGVKGVKGLSKLMKEIAQTASTGKHDNELIGRASISLKSVPTGGITVWYNLEKGSKTKSRGSVLVTMTISAEKNKRVAIQEHRRLLNLLLMHELDSSKVAEYWWNGKFNRNAELIRAQHAAQSGLTNFECAVSQWSVYSKIHENHQLSFTLFNNILDIIITVLKNLPNESEDIKTFWEGAKRILPSCFSIIRKIRARNVSDKHIVSMVCEVLDISSKIKSMGHPAYNLFPKSMYGFMSSVDQIPNDIDKVLVESINAGAKEWLEYIFQWSKPNCKSNPTDEENLQFLIKLIQMVRSDLQRAMEYFDKLFYHKVGVHFSSVLYKLYDKYLYDICKSIIEDVCSHIKRLDILEDITEYTDIDTESLTMGTTLFELYLVLKRFSTLGRSLCTNDELSMNNFYCWFMPGVTHWLDISFVKALNRIEKAIELDQLQPVDDSVKYTSSAVDTLAIFYQINIFWQQLDWPDLEGSYTFIAKIVHDVCRCCIFYSKRMPRYVEAQSLTTNVFMVSEEWCFAINNIDYIKQSLPTFMKELLIDELIQKIGELRTSLDADRCATTIKSLVDNALDTQKSQILEIIEIVARRMAPSIKRLLAEGAEVVHEDSNSMEKLMMYMESSLKMLYGILNELNFSRVLDAIWTELAVMMHDLIKVNIDKRRPPSFFHNLKQTLGVMTSCFKIGRIATSNIEVLKEIEKTLDLHAYETADLIHQYYIELLGVQKRISKSEYGQLTIKGNFSGSNLELHILNGRNLISMDPNGSCDSFVKVQLFPTSRFPNVKTYKTAVQHKTRFPLYDELFLIIRNHSCSGMPARGQTSSRIFEEA
ncbi:protein unc-13 homolog 4B isoform X2 [Eurosta solidaginis]|uniref:protein unc-13 homolog 4B isoform X2 n=1 Tax=Eurosta solidaginis TaxID=178769 RepID=UPI0035310158